MAKNTSLKTTTKKVGSKTGGAKKTVAKKTVAKKSDAKAQTPRKTAKPRRYTLQERRTFFAQRAFHMEKYRGCDLTGALFAGTRFEHCSFKGAVLNDVDMRNTRFFDCDFTNATMVWASVSGTQFQGCTGILPLPIYDARGHRAFAVAHSDGWRIKSGCRWFPIEQGLKHWRSRLRLAHKDSETAKSSRNYIHVLKWLKTQPLWISGATL